MFFDIFKKKKAPADNSSEQIPVDANWSFLGTDMHSHLIPGIDDGSQNVEDSLQFIRAFKEMGYKGIVTTPHIMIDHYPNTTETVQNGLARLRTALKEHNIDMPVRAAAEYYLDDHFMQLLERKELMTIHKNQVLVEMSFMFEPMGLNSMLFSIQAAGYKPILAHPERYNFFHRKPEIYKELKDRGCLLQLNMLSLAGYYGAGVKAAAESMLKEGLYDYCGSDLHHTRHLEGMQLMLRTKPYLGLANYPFLNSQITFE